jgi:hypothetical protein
MWRMDRSGPPAALALAAKSAGKMRPGTKAVAMRTTGKQATAKKRAEKETTTRSSPNKQAGSAPYRLGQ